MLRAISVRGLKYLGIVALVTLLGILGFRIFTSQRGLPLEPWHTYVPHEMDVGELDHATWADYLKAEDALMAGVRVHVTQRLSPEDRVPVNRYFDGSPVYPGHFARDWNRSYELRPDGSPRGIAVFLHGLTDSPYSLRHIARCYRDHGYVSVAIRMPGHGTVPGGLTDVEWQQWLTATRLAVREGRRVAGSSVPLHIVGFSNGATLALMYALDALDDASLSRPSHLVLIAPMIGITRFARFAGLAGLPAIFPAFAKAAWLSILPEFNPFKYNSFPINGARQSYLLTAALQTKIMSHAKDGRLAQLAPILTFQSAVDFTVSTRAVVSSLFAHLPANGSELVLFDVNRNSKLGLLRRPATYALPDKLLPPTPRTFTTSIIGNLSPDDAEVAARVTEAGSVVERVKRLELKYPRDVFSLSHVALPFPINDDLYGLEPEGKAGFGIRLGNIAARGERNSFIVNLDWVLRMSSNPFYPYLIGKIEDGMGVEHTCSGTPLASVP
jgi:alpha-beta hydrolase superfamily lysophospholipase